MVESKEIKQSLTLVIKEEVSSIAEISEKIKPLFEKFKKVIHDELPEGLLPMRDIQHHDVSILHDFKDCNALHQRVWGCY